jgi:hypothetical protein
MATNKPIGDKARKGAVRKRSQLKVKVQGEDPLDQARNEHRRVQGPEEDRQSSRACAANAERCPALFSQTKKERPTMCLGLVAVASALTLGCLVATASAQCDNKSQQNAADEAAVRGDLAAGSECADPSDVVRSEQKVEDAAAQAKRKTDQKSGTDSTQGDRRESPPVRPSDR